MNKRTVAMIGELANTKQQHTLSSLAQHFDVSERTVRNDLKEIGTLLKENGLEPLRLVRGGVVETAEDFPELVRAVSPNDYYSYKLSPEERKMVAAALLISSAGYITLADIADSVFVSRATIIADLDGIKQFIADGGLEVTSHPNKGLLVEGKESVKRWFLFQLSAFGNLRQEEEELSVKGAAAADGAGTVRSVTAAGEAGSAGAASGAASTGAAGASGSGSGIGVAAARRAAVSAGVKFAGLDGAGFHKGEAQSPMINVQAGDAITIQKILNEQSQVHGMFLSDSSFLKIQKYLGIMISRNLQGEYIEPQEPVENKRYTYAQDILRNIAQYCGIRTTVDEVYYLSSILNDCRYVHKQDFAKEDVRIQMVTRQFIHSISEDLETNLENDYDFFENLSNHLQSMYASDASQFPENPELAEIVEDHPDVERAVMENLGTLQRYDPREITEVERMYIVIHVCAALERKKNSEVSFHVIVACHAGIGTSQLLLERLKKHFHFQIVDVISAHEASMLEPGTADFVISTIPLEHCKLDHVVVSPMFSDEDYIRVGNKIDALRGSRNLPSRIEEKDVTAKGVLERIRPILEREVPEKADALMRLIRREVRLYFNETKESEEEIAAPYLHQLLPPDHIQIDVECGDWREAIRKAGAPLEKMGYIEHRYIEAMVRNVEENGPYVVISPGFAVPHEGIDMGSIRTGMNLIRLAQPVPFGEEEFDPIEFVCVMSAVDHKTHLKAFFNLVNMLLDENFHEALHEAASEEEMARIIERYEYSVMK